MSNNFLGSLLLRIGFVFLFVWFGSMQIINPAQWTALIPENVIAATGQSAHNLVLINGSLELLGALLIAVNLFVPAVAFLLALHIIGIVFIVGHSPVGARDIALATSLLALAVLSWKRRDA